MNLLGIQDALKNASDQQLMQLMRAPDSTTPSYLVVSELNRRKQMRAKQAEPPSRTVAEDLTKDQSTYADQEGIRSLRMPGYEDEARAAEGRSEGDGIDAMREGGAVRMSGGGGPPALPGDFYGTSMADFEEQARNQDYERAMSGIETNYNNVGAQNLRSSTATQLALADIRSRINSGTPAEQAFAEAIPGYRMADAGGIRQLLNLPSRPVASTDRPAAAAPAAPSATTPARAEVPVGPAASAPPASSFASDPSLLNPNAPPRAFDRPAANAPGNAPGGPQGGPGNTRAAGGGGGGGGAAAPAGTSIRALTPDGEAPNMQTIMERNLGLIPGMPQELLDRIRSSRTNEGERRREAQNMALLEAGLRIASSNNPRLAGAIGEGAAPAVQAYGQQLSQIRQDQRADLQTEMATAQFDLQRRYMAGQISSSEYRTALTELGAWRRTALQEAGQDARSRASIGSASADRALARQATISASEAQGRFTPERWARMSDAEKQAAREVQQLNAPPRGADVSGLSGGAAVARTELENARKELNEYLSLPPGNNASATARATWDAARKRAEERVAAANNRYNSFMDRLAADRPGSPGAGTGTPPPPPGFRIQQ